MKKYGPDDRDITVARGERFELVAPAMTTGGYRWLLEIEGPQVAEVEQRFEKGSGAIGGGAEQHIVLEGARKGEAVLRLSYEQAGSTVPDSTREIRVRVQ